MTSVLHENQMSTNSSLTIQVLFNKEINQRILDSKQFESRGEHDYLFKLGNKVLCDLEAKQ